MYARYFGLEEQPFSIAPNPRYLFMSDRHREALAHLLYGVNQGGGFVLLTGEVGTGKTTISRCLLEQLPEGTDVAFILNPFLNSLELLATICDELNIPYIDDEPSLKDLTDQLHHFLLRNHAKGRNTILIIDEAQHLQFEVLEQIRLLTNLETNTKKLLQIIFIGQPELQVLLSKPALRQLSQRITARFHIEPLTFAETQAYIRHRLQVAGLPASQDLFSQPIVKKIQAVTGGIPRLINIVCDRMLLGSYAQNKARVDDATFRQAVREVLGKESGFRVGVNRPAWIAAAVSAVFVVLSVLALYSWMRLQQPSEKTPIVSSAVPTPAVPVAPVQQAPAASAQVVTPHGVAPSGDVSSATATPLAVTGVIVRDAASASASPAAGTQLQSNQGAAADAAVPDAEKSDVKAVQSDSEPAALQNADAASASPWFATREQATKALLHALSIAPGENYANPCGDIERLGLRCELQAVKSWLELKDFNRPSVLVLRDKAGQVRYAALTGINATQARLATRDRSVTMPLSTLGEMWDGQFVFLWRPPANYERPLAVGDRSVAVAWVALRFAEIDGERQVLSGDKFNEALAERVKLFQREYRLRDDGIIGVQTLLKLNDRLGLDRTLNQETDAGTRTTARTDEAG